MKIIFSDLDGTLLSREKTLDAHTLAVLDKLAHKGIEFVPCTARAAAGVVSELLAHPSVHYVIGSNGAAIYSLNKTAKELPSKLLLGEEAAAYAKTLNTEVIHRVDLDPASVLWLYEQVAEHNIMFDVSGGGKTYSERARYDRMDQYDLSEAELRAFKSFRTPIDITIPELLPQLEHIERVTVYWKDRADRQLVTDLVDAREDMVWANSIPINIEISNVQATKGTGLLWLCEQLGIDAADAVAFGDGMNDIPMLVAAGDGVAMANSAPEVFEYANHIARDNDAPGVALYIEEKLAAQ